jgi:cell division protein FtsW (lipid II flippase)
VAGAARSERDERRRLVRRRTRRLPRSGTAAEAHTDFIYAVVGEELGILGSLIVLGLFTAIGIAGLRLARTTTDPFVRTASAAVVAWILTQALLNMGAVLGLIPITGVPLPLVSYGGSSLIPTLVAMGMLMAFARAEAGRPAPHPLKGK